MNWRYGMLAGWLGALAACGEDAPSARPSDVAARRAGRGVAGSAEIQQVAAGPSGENSAGCSQDDFRHRLLVPAHAETKCRDAVIEALRAGTARSHAAPILWHVNQSSGEARVPAASQTVGWQRAGRVLLVAESRGDDLIVSEWNGCQWASAGAAAGAIVVEPLLSRIPLLDVAAFVDGTPIPSQTGSLELAACLARREWIECVYGPTQAGGNVEIACPLFDNGTRWCRMSGVSSSAGIFPLKEVIIWQCDRSCEWEDVGDDTAVATYRYRELDAAHRADGPETLERLTVTLQPDGSRRSQGHRYSRLAADRRWDIARQRLASPEQGTAVIDGGLGLKTSIGSRAVSIAGQIYDIDKEVCSPFQLVEAARSIATLPATASQHAKGNEHGAVHQVPLDGRAAPTAQGAQIAGELGGEDVRVVMAPVPFAGDSVSSGCQVMLLNRADTKRRIERCVPTCGCVSTRVFTPEAAAGEHVRIDVAVHFNEPTRRRERIALVLDDGSTQFIHVEAAAMGDSLLFASPRCIDASAKVSVGILLMVVSTSDATPDSPMLLGVGGAPSSAGFRFTGWQLLRRSGSCTGPEHQFVWRGELSIEPAAVTDSVWSAVRVGTAQVRLRWDGVPWK